MDRRTYRMAPELRRSAIDAMIGFALLAIATYWVCNLLERGPLGTVISCAVFAAISMAMIFPLRWSTCADESGVSRRQLLRWDLWTWSDFSSGRIEKSGFTLIDPQRSWWHKCIVLDFVADGERKELVDLINKHYEMPMPPPMAEMLEIKWGFRHRLELLWHGIRFHTRGGTFCYGWKDVRRLRITRLDSLRRDFVRLTLSFSDQEIDLGRHKGAPIWRGASAEELNEFLVAHVPSDRVNVDIEGEFPLRREDVQKEIDQFRTSVRGLRYCMAGCGVLFLGLLIAVVVDEGVMRALRIAIMIGLTVPIYWLLEREFKKRIAEREAVLLGFPEHETNTEPTGKKA